MQLQICVVSICNCQQSNILKEMGEDFLIYTNKRLGFNENYNISGGGGNDDNLVMIVILIVL